MAEIECKAPSIRKVIIECDKPKNYGAYSYWFEPITSEAKNYDGIKKDKLPIDGGKDYWSSSDDKEFLLHVQGDKEMFDLHITKCVPEEMYIDLQIKEDALLREKYPKNIKSDNRTYNNSYGILPFSKSNLIVSEEMYEYFEKTKKSDWLKEEPEDVEDLLKMPMAQIRHAEKKSHVTDIVSELKVVAGNTKFMNPVLIFEGVAHIFNPDLKNEDIIVGTKHGLLAAKKAKVQKLKVVRVPFSVLKDKTEHYLRALAGHDNAVSKLKYNPGFEDVAKMLQSLWKDSKFTIPPLSSEAKAEAKRIYKHIGGNTIKKGQERADTLIKMNKKGNTTWINYTKAQIEKINEEHETKFPERISICLAVGMYDYRKIINPIYEDRNTYTKVGRKKKVLVTEGTGQCRKDITIHTWANESIHLETWELEFSDHKKQLNYMLGKLGVKFRFTALKNEESDTTKK